MGALWEQYKGEGAFYSPRVVTFEARKLQYMGLSLFSDLLWEFKGPRHLLRAFQRRDSNDSRFHTLPSSQVSVEKNTSFGSLFKEEIESISL